MAKIKSDIDSVSTDLPEETEAFKKANEALQEENALLKQANEALQEENDKLKAGIEDQNTIIEQKDDAIARITEQMKGFVQGSISIVSDDDKKIKASIPGQPVEIDGVQYEFQKPVFSMDGRTYSAQEASADTKVLKKVLAIDGQTILKELV